MKKISIQIVVLILVSLMAVSCISESISKEEQERINYYNHSKYITLSNDIVSYNSSIQAKKDLEKKHKMRINDEEIGISQEKVLEAIEKNGDQKDLNKSLVYKTIQAVIPSIWNVVELESDFQVNKALNVQTAYILENKSTVIVQNLEFKSNNKKWEEKIMAYIHFLEKEYQFQSKQLEDSQYELTKNIDYEAQTYEIGVGIHYFDENKKLLDDVYRIYYYLSIPDRNIEQ